MNMETLGYIGALIMGLLLGFIGGGGSILTVPILIYLFNIEAHVATTYSLLVVGIVSFYGSINNIKNKIADFKTAILFVIPSAITVYFTKKIFIANLPDPLININYFTVSKHQFTLSFFIILMFIVGYKMIFTDLKVKTDEIKINKPNILILNIAAIVVGIITSIAGVGGSFLILPVLITYLGFSFKKAVATALLIVTFNSLLGFSIDIQHHIDFNWHLLTIFTSIAIIGEILGQFLSKKIPIIYIKKTFGFIVILMAISILIVEIQQ
ncbi:MAG: hypothetical protein RLZZ175_401 [Bacteroidota bacterium]